MKKFYQLNEHERDAATNHALQHLVMDLVDEVLFIHLKDYHPELEQAITLARKGSSSEAYAIVLNAADLRTELMDIAEMAAENAFYSEPNDFVVNGVAS